MSNEHKISGPVLSEMHHSLRNEKYVVQISRPVEKLFINYNSWLKYTIAFDKPKIFSSMFFTSELMWILKSDLLPYIPFSVDAVTQDARDINVDLKVNSISGLKRKACSNNVTG